MALSLEEDEGPLEAGMKFEGASQDAQRDYVGQQLPLEVLVERFQDSPTVAGNLRHLLHKFPSLKVIKGASCSLLCYPYVDLECLYSGID